MLEQLISEVAREAGLPRASAARAVFAMMRFFTARLPSVLVGELHSRLQTQRTATAREDQDQSGSST